MDLGVTMSAAVLEDKIAEARERRHKVATWNTRRLPTRLTPGWTNRLFVARGAVWCGYFKLSGEVYWNPRDEEAPYALIFDPRTWTETTPRPAPRFRGWRYLDSDQKAAHPLL